MDKIISEFTGIKSNEAEDKNTSNMFVLTNKDKRYGAVTILYPETTKMLLDKFPYGAWLLPSSVHEWIVLPKWVCNNPRDLENMVVEINKTSVLPVDQLSDNVFMLNDSGELIEVTYEYEY